MVARGGANDREASDRGRLTGGGAFDLDSRRAVKPNFLDEHPRNSSNYSELGLFSLFSVLTLLTVQGSALW